MENRISRYSTKHDLFTVGDALSSIKTLKRIGFLTEVDFANITHRSTIPIQDFAIKGLHLMAKLKTRSRVSADAVKKGMPDPVAAVVNLLDDEDDWIVVRKQRITILIPPLPVNEQLIVSNHTKGESQPEIERISIDTDVPILAATSPEELLPEREKSLSQEALECGIPVDETVDPVSRLSGPHQLMTTTSENAQMNSPRVRTSNHGLSMLNLRKQTLVYGDRMPLFNQSMRAIKIEKKIRQAGGLSSWLISLGLERFVKIFQQKKVNKFQLANLNMKKLKDMGAFAVGPRRKLLHALDCLCQPYCSEHIRLSADL